MKRATALLAAAVMLTACGEGKNNKNTRSTGNAEKVSVEHIFDGCEELRQHHTTPVRCCLYQYPLSSKPKSDHCRRYQLYHRRRSDCKGYAFAARQRDVLPYCKQL